MQARQPATPPPPSSRPLPRSPQRPPRKRRAVARRHPWGKIGETCAQLGAGSLAIIVAVVALASLIPHYRAQHERLQAVRLEVERTAKRVERLRGRLHRNFDPQQAEAVMQEQTARVDPQLWPIVFLEGDRANRPQ